MVIHSFDDVLRRQRQMHSVEVSRGRRVALPRPVRYIAVIYFATIELVILLIDNFAPVVSILSAPLGLLASGNVKPAAFLIIYVVIPAGLAWLSMNIEIDGRSPHLWIFSCLRYFARPKRTLAGRSVRHESSRSTYNGRVHVWWDIGAPRLHHGWISGGKVSVGTGVRFTHALIHRHLMLRIDDGCKSLCGYEVEDRLEVKP